MIGTPLGEVLLKAFLASPRQLRAAEELAKQRAIPPAQALVELSICTEEALAAALRDLTSLPRAPAGPLTAKPEALSRLPAEAASQHGLFPLALLDGGRKLAVAMIDPTHAEALEVVRRTAFAEPRPSIALVSQWKQALGQYDAPSVPLGAVSKTVETEVPRSDALPDRLRSLAEGQIKIGRVLRAVTTLLVEKGIGIPPGTG